MQMSRFDKESESRLAGETAMDSDPLLGERPTFMARMKAYFREQWVLLLLTALVFLFLIRISIWRYSLLFGKGDRFRYSKPRAVQDYHCTDGALLLFPGQLQLSLLHAVVLLNSFCALSHEDCHVGYASVCLRGLLFNSLIHVETDSRSGSSF